MIRERDLGVGGTRRDGIGGSHHLCGALKFPRAGSGIVNLLDHLARTAIGCADFGPRKAPVRAVIRPRTTPFPACQGDSGPDPRPQAGKTGKTGKTGARAATSPALGLPEGVIACR